MSNTVDVPYTPDILASAGMTRKEFEETARIATAAKLFQDGKITLGQAATMCGYGKVAFMDELARRGFSLVNLDIDDVKDELRLIHGDD